MKNYNIFSDFEKQKKLKEIENESKRLKKPKYWILKQIGIPKSTYYDWIKSGGKSKSKAPNKVWNKTPEIVENLVIKYREDNNLMISERSSLGIATRLEKLNILISESGVYNILKRNNKNRKFKEYKKVFIIYPKSNKFLEVVCIDDIALSNNKPRELSVFNAIDEYSSICLKSLFLDHRVNRYDVIELLEEIKKKYGKLPKILRLDNAKAHISLVVKQYCQENNIKLQFIDKGTPQQNWPVESFNAVIEKDLIYTKFWQGWSDFSNKQEILDEYIEYYNNIKPLKSDCLKRTPNEIGTGNTSTLTQRRLKIKLIRKHYGQIAAKKEIDKYLINNQLSFTTCNLSEMCVS